MSDGSIKTTARWGSKWQSSGEWRAHTVDEVAAARFADGYLGMLEATCGWRPQPGMQGLDIGAGAGHIANALSLRGIHMVGVEWNEAGLTLMNSENPSLETRLVDVMEFHEPDTWDFILCRELYPFTRTNSFTDQHKIIERLIDSLKPQGCLLLIASDASRPHCLDQRLLLQVLRKNPQVAQIAGQYLEALVCRPGVWRIGQWGYKLLSLILLPLLWWKKHFRNWVTIYVTAIRKR